MKTPDRQRLKSIGVLLVMGLAYYLEIQTLGFSIPCPLQSISGLRCPGCGLTTAGIAFLQGRFWEAAMVNLGLTLALPVLLPWLGMVIYRWLWHRPPKGPALRVVGLALVIWAVVWGIGRNFIGL